MTERCPRCRGELQDEETDVEGGKARLTCQNCNLEFFYETRGLLGHWKLIKYKRIKTPEEKKGA
jgi:transposase-like protein